MHKDGVEGYHPVSIEHMRCLFSTPFGVRNELKLGRYASRGALAMTECGSGGGCEIKAERRREMMDLLLVACKNAHNSTRPEGDKCSSACPMIRARGQYPPTVWRRTSQNIHQFCSMRIFLMLRCFVLPFLFLLFAPAGV